MTMAQLRSKEVARAADEILPTAREQVGEREKRHGFHERGIAAAEADKQLQHLSDRSRRLDNLHLLALAAFNEGQEWMWVSAEDFSLIAGCYDPARK